MGLAQTLVWCSQLYKGVADTSQTRADSKHILTNLSVRFTAITPYFRQETEALTCYLSLSHR